jgi:hypothetical protein
MVKHTTDRKSIVVVRIATDGNTSSEHSAAEISLSSHEISNDLEQFLPTPANESMFEMHITRKDGAVCDQIVTMFVKTLDQTTDSDERCSDIFTSKEWAELRDSNPNPKKLFRKKDTLDSINGADSFN